MKSTFLIYIFPTKYCHSAITLLLDVVLCSFNVVVTFCNDVILVSGRIWSYQMVGQGIDKFVFSVWGISKRHSIFFQFVSQVVNIPSIYVSFTTLSICSGMCCVLSELYKFVIFASDIWYFNVYLFSLIIFITGL